MATSRELTPLQRKDVERLRAMREEDIDYSDIPEVTDFHGFHRREFYRPVKEPVSLRLDADLIAWFMQQAQDGEKYQTHINRALREYVEQHRRSA
jgi:uncharacterized protein (DUF4415 family)